MDSSVVEKGEEDEGGEETGKQEEPDQPNDKAASEQESQAKPGKEPEAATTEFSVCIRFYVSDMPRSLPSAKSLP